MRFSHFFVDRPIFATVLAVVTLIIGLLAYVSLPITEYPEIAPPTIQVTANYPGANAETVAATVATPLEQEINGVENMLYLTSQSTSDGNVTITVAFRLGTDLDQAQVLVQNRVSIAEPRLPEDVRRLGVVTTKSSPDFLMVVHLLSPDATFDQLYVSNYAFLRIRDALARLDAVGNIIVFGAREYSLRVWLDPDRLAAYALTASDVVQALREQNVQVSGGILGQPPSPETNAFQLTVSTLGRLQDPRQFREIIVKSADGGRLVRVNDVARVELGARSYITNSYLNNQEAVAIAIFQRPGSNALQGAEDVVRTMEELKASFPPGLAYQIVYNPTEFIAESVNEVIKTLFEAVLLVVLVVIAFLQSWRASVIPIAAIPVSLIGTFAALLAFGFTLNILTLFGLVLAIGIVVDDAIVVVENIERNIAEGLSPREAAHRTMDEVGTALVAIALVLSAVFIPTAFVPGITGQFYRQFAVTIAVATIISAFNALTLSPALGALLLKPHAEHSERRNILARVGGFFASGFNRGFDAASRRYARSVGWIVTHKGLFLLIYAGLLAATLIITGRVPTGFIPQMDRTYAIVVVQLPDGAALTRTDEVVHRATEIIRQTPGALNAVAFAGFSGATFSNQSNAAAIFVTFAPWEERIAHGQSGASIIQNLQQRLFAIQEAFIFVVPPPPVPGIGNAGGFKMMVQDRGGLGLAQLEEAASTVIDQARQSPGLVGIYTTFSSKTPQIYLEIDRTKARMLNVPLSTVFDALQINLGSIYVNDFNVFGRVYQVTAQADVPFRLERPDILNLKVRSSTGALVPLGTLLTIRDITGPDLVQRYNLYPAIPVNGNALPGVSSGQALSSMEAIARQAPDGIGFEWTELAYQQKLQGNQATYIFLLCIVFVFLVLAAQYESWALPLAIILIVPMSVLAAMLGVTLRGFDNNILTQVGLIVLIGLAAKNAILIVEFARQLESEGRGPVDAVVEASRLRLRPILMTAFAFIFGVVPLVIAAGPGAEMRQALGTAVFAGMLGVTFFGLFLTPVFYVAIRKAVLRLRRPRGPHGAAPGQPAEEAATKPAAGE
jgi:HAE1 family hydrophobic/amphiphilic exporter-1